MVLDPDYLVADEPVSMIDASSRAEILYLLKDLQGQRGLTFLYITHDLASARHFADRIAVMYAGRIVELAPAGQLVGEARHPYTKALLAAVPEPDPANRLRQRAVVGGEPPDAGALPAGCAFHPRCPVAIAGTCERVVPPLIDARRRPPGGLPPLPGGRGRCGGFGRRLGGFGQLGRVGRRAASAAGADSAVPLPRDSSASSAARMPGSSDSG